MEIQELKAAIKSNELFSKFGNLIIFTGEESTLQTLYCKQIAKAIKGGICFCDNDYLSIKKSLANNSPLNPVKVYVIHDSSQFLKNEDLLEIAKHNIAEGKILILIFHKIDKRKSFFKDNKNIICEFEKMTTNQLCNIIKKQLPDLSNSNCEIFCQLVNNDYGRLLLELDKLKILEDRSESYQLPITTDNIFLNALKENLIYQEISDTSFELLDAILEKNSKKAFTLLDELRHFETDSFKVLGLVYSNLKNMLLINSGANLNINSFVKSKLLKAKNNFSITQLIRGLKEILNIEQGIKSGKIDNDMALEYMLIKLLF